MPVASFELPSLAPGFRGPTRNDGVVAEAAPEAAQPWRIPPSRDLHGL
ncbi:MAG: hypothetical protein LGR52_01450 [Candidatus Thiosymbion ectosymbiont of Robbea hypermnestra]|nr:hypothetical protein [Candidatus Thiosymbion ectosymbiont of Robbea hypermnestra]